MKQIRFILASLILAVCAFGAHAGVLSDYLENKGVDWLLRGQTFTPPATQYWALFTDTCTDAGPGTEVSTSGTAYARVPITASLANWSGTLTSAQTVASTGTSGTSYNLGAIAWSASTAAWGNLQSVGYMDASTAGNRLACINLTAALNVSGSGFTVQFPASSFSIQLDN